MRDVRTPIFGLAAVVGLAAAALGADETQTPPLDHPRLGEAAPAFELVSLSGDTVKLSDYEGKLLVLHFGAGW